MLGPRALAAMEAEAASCHAGSATEAVLAVARDEDRSRGNPARNLESAPGGPALRAFYTAPALPAWLRRLTGLDWERTGDLGTYSYYRREGSFLGVHRDIDSCDLAVITCVFESGAPAGGISGSLSLWPARTSEPVSAVRADPEPGRVTVRLRPGRRSSCSAASSRTRSSRSGPATCGSRARSASTQSDPPGGRDPAVARLFRVWPHPSRSARRSGSVLASWLRPSPRRSPPSIASRSRTSTRWWPPRILDGDVRTELVDGVLIDMNPGGPRHSGAVTSLNRHFSTAARERFDVRVQDGLLIPGGYLSPDLMVTEQLGPDVLPETALLIIEVSRTSRLRDLQKAAVYAAAGVREYWIVDVDVDEVLVHRDPDATAYATVHRLMPGDHITPLVDIAPIDVAALLARRAG